MGFIKDSASFSGPRYIMAPPNLMFSRDWQHESRRRKQTFPGLSSLSRVNIVMHVCTEANPKRSYLRNALGAQLHRKTDIKAIKTRTGLPLGLYSSSDLDSPFEHLRFNTTDSGKILVFHGKRNIIRAGKHTHADAFLSVLRFLNWSQCNEGNWFTGIATPNSVVNGWFKTPLTDALRTSPYVSYSDKFPGVSVNVAKAYAAMFGQPPLVDNCCTPEIYRSGKFIIPGVKTPQDLVVACMVLDRLYKQYHKS
jgi:hypothetical protein